MKVWMVLLIILIVLAAVMVVLYFVGKRVQKKQDERQEQIEAAKQTTTMLIIDKKPKLMRRSKLPIVKAKIGPRIMVLVADDKIFDQIPLKKEVKATVSGIYITDVRGMRGPLPAPPEKVGFFKKIKNKVTGKK